MPRLNRIPARKTCQLPLLDLQPESGIRPDEVLAGLRQAQKRISPKYFYDARGSALFEQICGLPEYYPTRTELAIMDRHLGEMAACAGPRAAVIEFGSGSGRKTRLLLERLIDPVAYIPVEISRDFLLESAAQIAKDYPAIEVLPVCADFTRPFDLPSPTRPAERNLIYFPGSTIGNFSRELAVDLLRVMRAEAGERGGALVGVDLVKPARMLEQAYNDAAGVTARFNLNVLARLNRELGANFDLAAFRHVAVWDAEQSRIEMRLVSQREQVVAVRGERFEFGTGEHIVTEHSHKYSLDGFAAMAAAAGFAVQQVWTDPKQLFSVQFLVAA